MLLSCISKSLRRFIDKMSYNKNVDEHVVVAELEKVGKNINGVGGGVPNFMIRQGNFKLILPKDPDSSVLDMMYNLKQVC